MIFLSTKLYLYVTVPYRTSISAVNVRIYNVRSNGTVVTLRTCTSLPIMILDYDTVPTYVRRYVFIIKRSDTGTVRYSTGLQYRTIHSILLKNVVVLLSYRASTVLYQINFALKKSKFHK